jgi:hypothetical protein
MDISQKPEVSFVSSEKIGVVSAQDKNDDLSINGMNYR